MIQDSLTPYIYKKPIILNRDETALNAAYAMAENGVGCVLVSGDEGEVIGILTDRDLACRLIAQAANDGTVDANIRLDQIMTPDPIMVDQMSSVLDVVQSMKDYGIRRVPVIQKGTLSEREKCLGIVTLDDLMATGAVDRDDLKQVIKSQVQIRERGIPNSMRSAARMEQARYAFFRFLCDELEMSQGAMKNLTDFLLGSIVKRLQPSAARRLLSPFPKLVRSELEVFMVGPDKAITGEFLVNGIMGRFSRKRGPAEEMIKKYWQALGELVGERVLINARAKLPRDIAELLTLSPGQTTTQGPERDFGNETPEFKDERPSQRGYVAADTVDRPYPHH